MQNLFHHTLLFVVTFQSGVGYWISTESNSPNARIDEENGQNGKVSYNTTPGGLISLFFQNVGLSLGSAVDHLIVNGYSNEVKFKHCDKVDPNICRIDGKPLQCGVPRRTGRIVNGVFTGENEYPWMVGVYRMFQNKTFNCAGSLISGLYVITAAHCVSDTSSVGSYRVVLGDHHRYLSNEPREIIMRISKIIVHPKFMRKTFDNDIALLKLIRTVQYSETINPVCLPITDEDHANEDALVIGWGRLGVGQGNSAKLQQAPLKIFSTPFCRTSTAHYSFHITDNMYCAGLTVNGETYDACDGDSGGPLLWTNKKTKRMEVVGLVSWGRQCGNEDLPGVYTRLGRYLKWIKIHTRDSCFCQ